MLVEHGANVNVAPMHLSLDLVNGITPLMFAAVSNDKSSFYYLLDHGANPNAKSKNGETPLMFLMQCENDDPDMTRALLSKGASVKDKARDGSDALYYALKRGNTPSVDLIREYLNK
jgi:ankyrin repeat protein